MMRHGELWRAIDRLAEQHGLSTSGLAKRAGLDPTAFNPSKRVSGPGKQRWPSTESIAKILRATDTEMAEFVALMGGSGAAVRQRIPVIGYAQAGAGGYFDDAGYPVGTGWDEVTFPSVDDPHAYALEIAGDSMMPLYRDGDIVLVSPGADVRRGDRVVVRTVDGEVTAKELARLTARKVDLRSINPAYPDRSVNRADISWMARILWASQ